MLKWLLEFSHTLFGLVKIELLSISYHPLYQLVWTSKNGFVNSNIDLEFAKDENKSGEKESKEDIKRKNKKAKVKETEGEKARNISYSFFLWN